jgi:hypothetical protein
MDGTGRQFPDDAIERGRLWREWISMDTPAIETRHVVRRAVKPRDRKEDWLPDVINAPTPIVNGLADAVRESMVGDQLAAEDRNRLIARAVRLGLNRFEANLLLAAVVHRATADTHPPVFEPVTPRPSVTDRFNVGLIVGCAVVLEIVVAVALWRVWVG